MVTKFPALTLTTTPCLGASGGRDLPGGAAGGVAGHTGEGGGGLATAELILVLITTLEVRGSEAGEAGGQGHGGAAWGGGVCEGGDCYCSMGKNLYLKLCDGEVVAHLEVQRSTPGATLTL